MRYSVGDMVTVRDWGDMAAEFGMVLSDAIATPGLSFTEEMKVFCGGIFEVERVRSHIKCYYLHGVKVATGRCYGFTDDMLVDGHVDCPDYSEDNFMQMLGVG